jgi:hypothetical protein
MAAESMQTIAVELGFVSRLGSSARHVYPLRNQPRPRSP